MMTSAVHRKRECSSMLFSTISATGLHTHTHGCTYTPNNTCLICPKTSAVTRNPRAILMFRHDTKPSSHDSRLNISDTVVQQSNNASMMPNRQLCQATNAVHTFTASIKLARSLDKVFLIRNAVSLPAGTAVQHSCISFA